LGLIISHSRRFVILAPWKAATSTVRARLGQYSESPYSEFYAFNPILERVVHQHLTYADFAALPESRLGYVTAAFVRNPYDRVYSGFRQLQKDIRQQPSAEFPDPDVRALVMRQLGENRSQLERAGFAFEAWLELLEDWQILEAGRNSSFPLHPSHYWTHQGGEQAVDFIGRVESFEADFDSLCGALGVEPDSRINANVDATADELPGNALGYRYADRMSPQARSRVNELFREDFELFGYQYVE
jgi:hypothetical protein